VPLAKRRGRTRWRFRHRGRGYVVFVIDGQLRVTDAACPHNGGPLAKGIVRDGSIICPWHWYRFDLQTGCCRTDASYGLRLYPVIWHDERAFVALPVNVRPRTWPKLPRPRIRAGRGG
jgi:nitrite reductase (NADH) small subunit